MEDRRAAGGTVGEMGEMDTSAGEEETEGGTATAGERPERTGLGPVERGA